MQLVQRMRLLQLVIVLAFLVTKNIKQRACVCHCAGGRGLGIDTATPDGAVYEYADYADYADTNTPITRLR